MSDIEILVMFKNEAKLRVDLGIDLDHLLIENSKERYQTLLWS